MISPQNQATNKKKTTPQQSLQDEQPQKCPRCDSSNTKFCYYNNYSLTQPRHYCKTCRRYWTRGGALRSVPIGGGCHKNRKFKTASFTTSTSSTKLFSTVEGGGREEFGSSLGFKFLNQNLNPGSTPAVEFNLGGVSLPKLHPATAGVFTQFITSSVPTPTCGQGTDVGLPYFGLDLLGLNYSLHSVSSPSSTSSLVQNNTISTIESLSTINQEMHWKLQQQRLASMVYGPSSLQNGEENKIDDQENTRGAINVLNNLEIANDNTSNNNNVNNNSSNYVTSTIDVGPTEWLFHQIQTSNCDNNNNNSYY